MAKRFRAKVTRNRKVYVHNDLSQAATTFNETVKKRKKAGDLVGLGFDRMACALMIAFAFEAKVNFMGAQLRKAGKLAEWNEFQSLKKKVNIVLSALGIATDRTQRPLRSMEDMKDLRDMLAHGKPVEESLEEVLIGTPDELEEASRNDLAAGWEKSCTEECIDEALADMDCLWRDMVAASGLNVFDTMTHGDGGIEIIAEVNAP